MSELMKNAGNVKKWIYKFILYFIKIDKNLDFLKIAYSKIGGHKKIFIL